ncbi:hypothetical protein GCM10007989_07690 [Devosia pacifica]|uniref:Uncharacterized protein n=1 Tax=Devosia pacifica TaxID=1335967 RepID=A0A918VPU2_9HYPH|nr:hypothetical protein [Devosia pacifica]GHA15383.1 hypothetical protein GCM10007989_07690 [Devosia pacifica]
MSHPATGPISPDELRRIADMPYGAAQAELQKHDPLWGKLPREEGEQIEWKVFVTQEVTMEAFVRVTAASAEEAMEIAETMPEGDFSWDYNSSGSVYAQDAEPAK